jgi:hypothetical protein
MVTLREKSVTKIMNSHRVWMLEKRLSMKITKYFFIFDRRQFLHLWLPLWRWFALSIHFDKSEEPHSIFFKIVFFKFFQRFKKLMPKCFFGNIAFWIKSLAAIWVVLEADYEIVWKKGR